MRLNISVLSLLLALIMGEAPLQAAQNAPARTMKVKVTAEQANLREKPDIGSAIVQQIAEGTVLEADRKEGEWFFVRYPLEDGGVIGGYIHESLVEVVEQAAAPERRTPEKRAPAASTPPPPARTAGRESAPAGLQFSISGGAGWAAPRDINDGARGFADYRGATLGLAPLGTVDTVHLMNTGGLELSTRVARNLSFGLGLDYSWGANRSHVEFTDGIFSETLRTKPSVSAVPVKATVRFYPGRGFYIRGSLGVYSLKASYLYRLERVDSWQQWSGSATGHAFGGEAAFGGDWAVGGRSALFIEAGFRLASVGSFKGEGLASDSDGASLTETGRLYIFRMRAVDDRTYPLLFVRESPPSDEGVSDVRPAGVNLSGTFIRVGVRFRI